MSQPEEIPVLSEARPDPESLVLRSQPRSVIRFRKGLTIGLAAAISATLVGLAWSSLKPPVLTRSVRSDPDLASTGAVPESLSGLPAGYGDVPRLGPPLPGDLGRAILDRRRQNLATGGEGLAQATDDGGAARVEERQRQAAADQAARLSALLVQPMRSGPAVDAAAPGQRSVTGTAGRPASPSSTPEGASAAGAALPRIAPPHSRWTLSAGTVIPAALITGINSEIPGLVVAQVTEPVRDSLSGRTILIPQGARLIGSFDSAIGYGQTRARLVWQRLLFPDGASLDLDSMPASDAAGYSGVADRVDLHEWRLMKGVALATILGIGAQSGGGSNGDLARAIRDSAQDEGERAGDQIVARDLKVSPTLTVRPGWPVQAILDRDRELKPWEPR
jgi:type IV secretion system protein VirB10